MNNSLLIAIIFIILWIVTFFPAWSIFIKLLAISTSNKKFSHRFWLYMIVYRLLIAFPYVVVLFLGQDTLPAIAQIVIVGFVIAGLFFSIVRFVLSEKIITFLWWIYGFVYDGLLSYAPYRRLTQRVVELSHHTKPEAKTILELGCGTGNVITRLRHVYPHASIIGIDSSTTMLNIAKKKHPQVKLLKQDILGSIDGFKDASIDLIIMQNSLYVVKNRHILWQQMARILAEDGLIVVTNSDRVGSSSITKEHFKYGKWYELLNPKLVAVGLIDYFISSLSKEGVFNFIDERVIKNEVSEYFEMSQTDRVYGGVNILFTLRHR